MKKPYQSIRLFKSDTLERLSHVHPIVPLLLWTPVIAFLIWRSFFVHGWELMPLLGLGMTAVLTWTLFEYLLHRFVFHLEKSPIAWVRRFQYILHGLHHDDPVDPTRLVMPPAPAIILGSLIYFGILRPMMGGVHADPFMAFFLVGYLAYDYIHYAVHHFRPRTPIGRYLKNHHMQHHYVTQEARWGVSSPLWDFIFGSLNQSAKKKVEEAREITA